MAKQLVSIESLEDQLFQLKLEKAIQTAYEKGIEDGRTKYSYPFILRKSDLVEIMQIKLATLDKLLTDPNFPRLKNVQARYPRDEVFKWIEKNTHRLP